MMLYHFTCAHSAESIRTSGMLTPNPHPVLDGAALVWLADLEQPDREALGLTSTYINCDRTEYVVTVEQTPHIERWGSWAHYAKVSRWARDRLEEGRSPAHWWVSEKPVPILGIRGSS